MHADTCEDEELEAVANQYGVRVLSYWLVLMCHSKKSHHTNNAWSGPWTLLSFAAAAYDDKATKKTVRETLTKMVEVGLLEVRESTAVDGSQQDASVLVGRWRARPSKFLELQDKAASAETTTQHRDNLQGFNANSDNLVTTESGSCDNVVTPSRARITETDTKTETEGSKLPKDAHDADPASWLNSDATYQPPPTDQMIAFIDQMRSILMDAYQESSAGQLAEAVYRMSAKRGPMTTTYPDEQWMRAAQELVKAIKDRRIENPSKGAAWIRAAVPTAVGELDTVDGVGEPAEDPDVVRVREMAARYNTEGAA